MAELSQKVEDASVLCIVTGASKGFGRAICLQVCKEWGIGICGNKIELVVVARDKTALENTAIECKSVYSSVSMHVLCCDLSEHGAMQALVEQLRELCQSKPRFKQVFLFANAGGIGNISEPISTQFDPKPLQKFFDLMLTSNVIISSWFISELKAVKKTIIYVSSLLAVQPVAGLSMYSAGKAGGHMLFRCIAEENPEVRVLVYSPGPLQTDMMDDVLGNICFKNTKELFTQAKSFKPEESAAVLFKLLRNDEYKSGEYIDIYDVIKK